MLYFLVFISVNPSELPYLNSAAILTISCCDTELPYYQRKLNPTF